MRGRLRKWMGRVGLRPVERVKDPTPIEKYLLGGQLPWSEGYVAYKADYIRRVLGDAALLDVFRQNGALPPGYGRRLDERVVEYPWILSRLTEAPTRVMDAGGILIFPNILKLPLLEKKWLLIYTLEENRWRLPRRNTSCVYGDLRKSILKDESFDEILCVSTLEHIGLDNTQIYTADENFRENNTQDYQVVLREFRRILAPGGTLLVTVPYGSYQNHGWLQQFDRTMIEAAVRTFDGELVEQAYYKFEPDGWRAAAEEECRDAVYFDIHATAKFDADFAPAARAVACLALRKRA